VKKVVIGLIGSGFAARLHCEAYQYVHGVQVWIKAVASTSKDVNEFAREFNIPDVYTDYRQLLADPEIDVVDIVLPPVMHKPCILDAIAAKKHIICEKPLTGYFGLEEDQTPVGLHVSRQKMLNYVKHDLEEMRDAIESSGLLFMYAENWIYAPSIQKSVEFLKEKKIKQLFIKAEESHSGSHAIHAPYWSKNGGGSLIRQGSHPLSTVLYLKKVEAMARNESIDVISVMADTADISSGLSEEDRKYLNSRPVDVEDWACTTISFSDGTKSVIFSGDMVLGGVKNYVEIYGSNGVIINNISPNNTLETYFPDEKDLEGVYITEKVQNKSGWQKIFLAEIFARGYVGELQDFMECVLTGRQPISDYWLASVTTELIYASYLSAFENRKVSLGLKLY